MLLPRHVGGSAGCLPLRSSARSRALSVPYVPSSHRLARLLEPLLRASSCVAPTLSYRAGSCAHSGTYSQGAVPCQLAGSSMRRAALIRALALSRSRALALSRSRTLALALVHFSALALSWPAASLRDSLRERTACPPSGTPLTSAASSRLALPRQPLVPRAPRRRSRDSLRRAAARCTPRY